MRNEGISMRTATIIAGMLATVTLSGCGSSGIFDRERPDEFAVSRQPPLVIPPDFTLVPPRVGDPSPQVGNLQQQTLEAMFGGPSRRSPSESSVVSQAGSADGGIRSSVGDVDTNTVDKGTVTSDIVNAPESESEAASATAN